MSSKRETNDRHAVEVEEVEFMKKVAIGCKELADQRNAIACSKISDLTRVVRPIDDDNVEVVESQQLTRRLNVQVARLIVPPAVDENARRLVGIERALRDRSQIAEAKLDGILKVASGRQQDANIAVSVEHRIDVFGVADRCAVS